MHKWEIDLNMKRWDYEILTNHYDSYRFDAWEKNVFDLPIHLGVEARTPKELQTKITRLCKELKEKK